MRTPQSTPSKVKLAGKPGAEISAIAASKDVVVLEPLVTESSRGSRPNQSSNSGAPSESLPRNDWRSLRPAGGAARLAACCRVAWHSCRILDCRWRITPVGNPRALGVAIVLSLETGVIATSVARARQTRLRASRSIIGAWVSQLSREPPATPY